jgi:hypothetical protein
MNVKRGIIKVIKGNIRPVQVSVKGLKGLARSQASAKAYYDNSHHAWEGMLNNQVQ